MKVSPQVSIGIVIALLVIIGAAYFLILPKTAISPGSSATTTPATAITYSCTAGSMQAAFSDASVHVTLSDGRSFTLPQVRSGSGVRYESTSTPGQDIELIGEGSNAMFIENGKTTYENCVVNAAPAASETSTTKTFTDAGKSFSFSYPSQFTVSGGGIGYGTDWEVNATSSGMLLAKLIVPTSFQPKTNFGDATFTIGTSADSDAVAQCTTFASTGGAATAPSQVTIHGITYTKFNLSDAGAGNLYQTTTYRVVRNHQCYVVEYTIHSANIANYSPDQGITAFDQAKVQSVLEGIVQSVTFNQGSNE